jgi:hypothetical protein
MSRTDIINLAGDIWVLVAAASFLASLIAGAVQIIRDKPIEETPALPVLIVLHWAWAIPLTLMVCLVPCIWLIGLIGQLLGY